MVHTRRSLAGLLLTALMITTGCSGSGSNSGVPDLSFEQYQLGNGLNVILRKDDRLPIAAVNLWYHVGPANEAPGRTGFAHLFEHMMFQGSGHIAEGEADKQLDAAGATGVNATTSYDRTNYFETVPSNALELALWQESDRMGFLLDALDQAQLSNQQAVVRNERRERYEVPPYGLTNEVENNNLFPPGHPYHAGVIGTHADIQSAQLDDVRSFFKQYYVPNNASLAIVGDIDVAATKAMIEKYFGGLPRGADVPKPSIKTPPLTSEKRITRTDTVQLPRVTMAWLTPPYFAPGDAEADVTARVLGGGKASRLYEKLVLGSQIAQSVTAYQQSLALGSIFEIEVTAKPGHSAQELEAAVQREIDALKQEGPKPDELAAAKTGFRSTALFNLQDPAGVADTLNGYAQYTGDPGYLEKDLRRYDDVTADAVKRFAVDQLPNDRRVVITTVPGPKVLPAEPPTPPAPPASAPGTQPPSADPWRNTVPQPGPAVTKPLPGATEFSLANGLKVYLLEDHTLPLAVAALNSRSGSSADPPNQPGLAGFSVDMLEQGTKTRDALGIAREADALGAKLGSGVSDDGSSVSISALTPQLGQAVGLMADVVLNPAFGPAEVERVRQERLVSLRQETDSPDSIADRVMRREVFGGPHPYGHPAIGDERSVRTINAADLARFHQQAFSPGNCALVLAGDLTPDAARKLAEDAFGKWTGPAAELPRPGAPVPGADRVLVVDKPGSAQTNLVLAQPGVARNDPDYEKLMVMNDVLGGGSASRVNINIREQHGYAYGAFTRLGRNRGVSTYSVESSVQTQFTGPSVAEMLNEVRGIQAAPITPEELNRAKASIIRTLPTVFLTGSASAQAIGRLYLYDLPPDYYAALPKRVEGIDAAQVQEAAKAHLQPDQIKVIAVGDRAKIGPQLAALNLGPVVARQPDASPAP